MAANTDTDIVELIIDAKNLSSDELNQSAQDVKALGDAARKAEVELNKLKIQQDTIASYEKVKANVTELRGELARAEVAYENLSKAVKNNSQATDDDRLSVKLAKNDITDLKRALSAQDAEYRKLAKTVKAYGTDTKDTSVKQQELSSEIDKADSKVKQLSGEYQKQITTLREKIAVEKQSLTVSKEKSAELDDLVKAETAALEAERKRAAQEAANAAEAKRSTESLAVYREQLEELTFQREEGRLSQSKYIEGEAALRNELKLSEAQVKTVRAVLNAESAERKQVAKAIEDQTKAIRDQEKELNDLIAEEQKSLDMTRKREQAEREAAEEAKRVVVALKQYEAELTQLNQEKAKGTVSTADYIRKEAALRQQLQLTESQVKTSKQAIQAEATEREKSVRSTDMLTTVTRRLAQAYTVLLAAQKAVQAVGTGVENYGELEAAITKVEKTTGNARVEVEKLADQLKDMSEKVTPTSTNELLRMAEVAGQLGTKSTADILNLVAAADALGLSTNLAGDEAATMLARILGMTKEGIPEIQNLSSAVVALGNDFAITEADIVHMTKEIVSGTREINLGSAAAAAFGATLAELGQPAERSRTAIQRLSGAINEASKKGGDDLERLTKITGQTAAQIEKDLGEAPEKVLVKFLEGLQRVKAEGGLVSDALKGMGIDGTEATGVLSVLADGTDRLKVALELSNKAFEAGNYHMREAAKAYADQESAIGRLKNEFHTLTTSIGEAFSDETDQAIRATSDVIKLVRDDVVNLMEYLPEIGKGFIELATDLDTLFGDGGVGDNLGAIEELGLLTSNAFNSVTFAVNRAGLALSEINVATLEFMQVAGKVSGIEFISQEQIDNAKNRSKSLGESVRRDLDDIIANTKRMNGESSIAYEGLVSNAVKYRDSLDKLSVTQRNQINDILLSGQYNKDLDKTYRELTAALVRANRETEIEAELKAKQIETTRLKNEEDKKAIEVNIAAAAALLSAKQAQEGFSESTERAGLLQGELNRLYSEGKFSAEDYKNASTALLGTISAANVETEKTIVLQKSQTELTTEFIAKRKELQAQYEAGLLTEKELVIEQQLLATAYDTTVANTVKATETTGLLSEAQLNLQDKIVRTTAEITELQRAMKDETKGSEELALVKAKLAKEEANLAAMKREAIELSKIENANYTDLILMQREYTMQLEILERNFRAGLLTKQEYDAQSQVLKGTLSELTKVIDEVSGKTDENTKATKSNTAAIKDNTEASIENIQVVIKQLSSVDDLRKSQAALRSVMVDSGRIYANTSLSAEELTQRINALNSAYITGEQKRERAELDASLRVVRLIDQIDRGAYSLEQLDRMSHQASSNMYGLSGVQLDPLLEAIDNARSKFQELNDEINDATADIQDRLDKALGNEKDIVKRKFAREVAEIEQMINAAKAYGDSTLVAKLQKSLSDLKRAQDLEYKAEFGTKTETTKPTTTTKPVIPGSTATPPASTPSYTPSYTPPASTPGTGETVVLQLQVGTGTFNATMEKKLLNQLMAEIKRQQGIS